jgi:MFS superfamily sulfate permease-like transporter
MTPNSAGDGLEGYHDVHSYPSAHLPGLVIYRFDGPLFFANATTFRDEIRRMARADPPPRWILVAPSRSPTWHHRLRHARRTRRGAERAAHQPAFAELKTRTAQDRTFIA